MIKELFGEFRIVGLAGDKSSGKTNNLMALIEEFRQINKTTNIYVFGLNEITIKWLKRFNNIFEISSLAQLSDKENSLIIIDEFQKLKLNDRRHKDLLNDFVDFIYHRNNWCILSSPNIRDFNSVIGSKIERWALKSLKQSSIVNGSQLKDAVVQYNGRFKCINDININKDKLLIINEDFERVIQLRYIKEVDNKKQNIDIFCQGNAKELSEKLSR